MGRVDGADGDVVVATDVAPPPPVDASSSNPDGGGGGGGGEDDNPPRRCHRRCRQDHDAQDDQRGKRRRQQARDGCHRRGPSSSPVPPIQPQTSPKNKQIKHRSYAAMVASPLFDPPPRLPRLAPHRRVGFKRGSSHRRHKKMWKRPSCAWEGKELVRGLRTRRVRRNRRQGWCPMKKSNDEIGGGSAGGKDVSCERKKIRLVFPSCALTPDQRARETISNFKSKLLKHMNET